MLVSWVLQYTPVSLDLYSAIFTSEIMVLDIKEFL